MKNKHSFVSKKVFLKKIKLVSGALSVICITYQKCHCFYFPIFQKHPSNPLQNYYPLKSIPLHPSCSLLPKAPSSDMLTVHMKNKDPGRG